MLLLIYIIIAILMAVPIVLIIFKPLRDWTNNHIYTKLKKSGFKEIIYFVVSTLTIVSILWGIITYYDSQEIKNKNQRIILENLDQEIEQNLNRIDYLKNNTDKILRAESPVLWKLDTYYLEESRDIIKSRKIRQRIFFSLANIKQLNNLLDIAMDTESCTNFTIKKENYDNYKLVLNSLQEDLQKIRDGLD